MHNLDTLHDLLDQLSDPEKEFLMQNLSMEIKEFDAVKEVKIKKWNEETKMAKRGQKEILSKSTENEKYLHFDYSTAV